MRIFGLNLTDIFRALTISISICIFCSPWKGSRVKKLVGKENKKCIVSKLNNVSENEMESCFPKLEIRKIATLLLLDKNYP